MPQPVKSTRALAEAAVRRRAARASHSGCAAIAVGCQSPPGTVRSIPCARVAVFERQTLVERPPRPHRADAAGAVDLVLRHARRRLALRDRRDERHRALRRAHVLQGHGAPPDRARHLGRDRRRSAASSTPSRARSTPATTSAARRAPRHRARRARRHAPPLALRRRGDRAREGRDRRGDEHVRRHAARPHRHGLRPPPLRRPAARLGDPRPKETVRAATPRHVPLLPRPLVPPGADGRRRRRPARRRSDRAARGAARRPRAAATTGGRRAGRAAARTATASRVHTKDSDQAHLILGVAQLPARASRPLRAPAALRPCSAADVVAPLHRGERAARARLLRLRARTRPTRTPARSTRRRVSTSTASTTR